jgi:hypothetical protein
MTKYICEFCKDKRCIGKCINNGNSISLPQVDTSNGNDITLLHAHGNRIETKIINRR